MDLNIVSIGYLFFKLSPFILVCFFSLQSVFNQDLKGIIYLVGLLLACFIAVISGNIPGFETISKQGLPSTLNPMCKFIELSSSGPISKLPLGQTVLSYTFSYLCYIILKYKLVNQNIATFIIFPILIVGDFLWNVSYGCSNFIALMFSLIIGSVMGIFWAYIVDSTGKVELQLFNGISNKEICSRPSRTVYRCRVRNGGTTPIVK
jgi:hypothetical protein